MLLYRQVALFRCMRWQHDTQFTFFHLYALFCFNSCSGQSHSFGIKGSVTESITACESITVDTPMRAPIPHKQGGGAQGCLPDQRQDLVQCLGPVSAYNISEGHGSVFAH